MDPERWQRIDSLLHAALERPPSERDAFLRRECAGDEALEREVRSLIAADRPAESFLNRLIRADAASPSPEDSTVTHLDGRTVSHYRVMEMLGAGGMGVVYKAFDTRLNRPVALKFLPPHLRHDADLKRRLSEEARAASTLDHPNIVVIHDIDETPEGDLFIAMAFHEGVTLRERIAASGPSGMPVAEALEIARQVAAGLARAHERGILHRDIKPGNVMVAADGVARIIDFGLAKANDATTSLEGSTKGTPLYMSPEQASGKPLDARSDLWSLGAMLFEMLSGRPPFTGEGNLAVLHSIVYDAAPRLQDLRPDVPPGVDLIVSRALQKDVAQRYQTAAEMMGDITAALGGRNVRPLRARGFPLKAAAVLVAALAAIGAGYYLFHRPAKLTDKDTVVLADFENRTGDPVFDDTLRQGLAAQLDQSPFLKLIADDRIQQTLKLMNRPPDAPLTPEVAREVCERTGSAAVLDGSIASLGAQFVLTVRARNCGTGEVLDREQGETAKKENVLDVLGAMGNKLRARLGETRVQQHETPPPEATTPSLEAFKAYSTGLKVWSSSGAAGAIPFFQRALELDPQFALAHSVLGGMYNELWEPVRAAESIAKAYEYRNRAGDRERFQIIVSYELNVKGDLEKVERTAEEWAATYPRDANPRAMLSWMDQSLGKYQKSIENAGISVELDPDFPPGYNNLAWSYLQTDRLPEAEQVIRRGEARKLDFPEFGIVRYVAAFVKGDRAEMARLLAAGQGKPGLEDWLVYNDATVLAFEGRLREARTKAQLAMEMAHQPALKERPASYQAGMAVREAFAGNGDQARQDAAAALAIARSRDVEYCVAWAAALQQDTPQSQAWAKDLEKLSDDTWVQFIYLPALRALWALNRGDASQALRELQKSVPYEGSVAGNPQAYCGTFSPWYARGLAYLKAGQGAEAAAQFRLILQHRSIAFTDPVGIGARVGLARALTLSGDTAQAKAAYQDFLELWKGADRETPLLKEVAAESARLR